MSKGSHFIFLETSLAASAEWTCAGEGWCFLRIREGLGYLLRNRSAEEVSAGSVVVLSSRSGVILRASQIGELRFDHFQLCPELLNGFFTLYEQHYLETAATQPKLCVRRYPASDPVGVQFAELVAQVDSHHSLAFRARMLDLVVVVLNAELGSRRPADARHFDARERFEQLIEQLPAAEIQNRTLGELAVQCGCSERHFSRLFRNYFGFSIRAKQMEMRLQRARQLLCESDTKVIYVAMESGFRHLGLFNAMFKKRFGMTPSECRQSSTRKKPARRISRLGLGVVLLAAQLLGLGWAQGQEKAPAPAAAAAPAFEVRGYDVHGNTVLSPEVVGKVLRDYTGPKVTFEEIRKGLAELQLAYRGRGFVSVAVSLPQQQLTNGFVRVQITEGRLAEINVAENRHFSSNNIMRSLPNLRTNIILNSQLFQYDLDQANANRDRSIYPVIGPGPEPGTTALTLKVKDRFPLHGRFEANNQSTPGTPGLRLNSSLQYNNLWQLDHQVGVQYLFTPEEMKAADRLPAHFFNQPLIASYSAFYRMPISFLGGGVADKLDPADFGYDEVTRRFRLPPPTGRPEITFYASRSDSDSGLKQLENTLTPSVIPPQGGLQVSSSVSNQTLSVTENLGWRVAKSLSPLWGIRSSLQFGLDFKSYKTTSRQVRFSSAALYIPPAGATSGPPFVVEPAPTADPSVRLIPQGVQYLPISFGWDGGRADKWGFTSLSLNNSFNFGGLLDDEADFSSLSGSQRAKGNFYVVNAGLTREQKIYEDWSLLLRANGQWANEPLISNEQFGLGGVAGVRGYRDGQDYGDTGWRVLFEPRTPMVDIGMVDGSMPMLVRGSVFMDYGERYLLDPGGRSGAEQMWGAGLGVSSTIGNRFDLRFYYAWALLPVPGVSAGSQRISFSVAAQF